MACLTNHLRGNQVLRTPGKLLYSLPIPFETRQRIALRRHYNIRNSSSTTATVRYLSFSNDMLLLGPGDANPHTNLYGAGMPRPRAPKMFKNASPKAFRIKMRNAFSPRFVNVSIKWDNCGAFCSPFVPN
jgi:hypothetical protein